MDCPRCGYKMKCTDSACVDNRTGRRYKCTDCDFNIYTLETPVDQFTVNEILAQKLSLYMSSHNKKK